MMIWDPHCHLSGVPGKTPEERTDQLLVFADRLAIQRIALSMGMNWSQVPSPEELRRSNDDIIAAVRHRPDRVFGYAYLSPKHIDTSLAELERCIANGPLIGVKLWVAGHCNAPEIDPIIKRAAQLNAPILQHTYIKLTGNLPGESTPMDLAQLARRHPDAAFICAHTGGDWEIGIRAVRDCKNISVDLCGYDATAGVTEMAVRELGAQRVLYGSDAGGRSFASQLGKVLGADISDADRKLVLAENFRRMLLPICRQKGITL